MIIEKQMKLKIILANFGRLPNQILFNVFPCTIISILLIMFDAFTEPQALFEDLIRVPVIFIITMVIFMLSFRYSIKYQKEIDKFFYQMFHNTNIFPLSGLFYKMKITKKKHVYFKGFWVEVESFEIFDFIKSFVKVENFDVEKILNFGHYRLKNTGNLKDLAVPSSLKKEYKYTLISFRMTEKKSRKSFSINAIEIQDFSHFFFAIPHNLDEEIFRYIDLRRIILVSTKLPIFAMNVFSEMQKYGAQKYIYNPFEFFTFKTEITERQDIIDLIRKKTDILLENTIRLDYIEYRLANIENEWTFCQLIVQSFLNAFFPVGGLDELKMNIFTFLEILDKTENSFVNWDRVDQSRLVKYLSQYSEFFCNFCTMFELVKNFFKIDVKDERYYLLRDNFSSLEKKITILLDAWKKSPSIESPLISVKNRILKGTLMAMIALEQNSAIHDLINNPQSKILEKYFRDHFGQFFQAMGLSVESRDLNTDIEAPNKKGGKSDIQISDKASGMQITLSTKIWKRNFNTNPPIKQLLDDMSSGEELGILVMINPNKGFIEEDLKKDLILSDPLFEHDSMKYAMIPNSDSQILIADFIYNSQKKQVCFFIFNLENIRSKG